MMVFIYISWPVVLYQDDYIRFHDFDNRIQGPVEGDGVAVAFLQAADLKDFIVVRHTAFIPGTIVDVLWFVYLVARKTVCGKSCISDIMSKMPKSACCIRFGNGNFLIADAGIRFQSRTSRIQLPEETMRLSTKTILSCMAFLAAISCTSISSRDDKYLFHMQRGAQYAQEGNYPMAIREFKKSIRLNGNWADSRYNLALAYEYAKQPKKAIQEYREALRICPGHAKAYLNLGNLYASQGDLTAATRHFVLALRFNPQDDLAWASMGGVFEAAGNHITAEDCFRKAVKLNPMNPDHYLFLGKLCAKTGKKKEAREAYGNCLRLVETTRPGYARHVRKLVSGLDD